VAFVEIFVWPEADVPPDLRRQVIAIEDQVWPPVQPTDQATDQAADQPADQPAQAGTMHGHDPALRPVSMLLVEDGRVRSALAVLSKQITHCGRRYAASGLSAVVTDPNCRGKGYGRQLAEAARLEMAARGADLGIFTCDPPLRSFYEPAGWQWLPGTVLVGGTPAAPFPSDQLGKITMGCFFSARARRSASIFLGCRVELYPGVIDKLW